MNRKQWWKDFYQRYFSLKCDFTALVIPKKPTKGTWRLLIVAQGLTLDTIRVRRKKLPFSIVFEHTVPLTKDLRTTENAYAVWVSDDNEPDEQYQGKPCDVVDPHREIGETLLERLLHEIVRFEQTGKHLDEKGTTLCSGSRYADGEVPCVNFSQKNGEVYVNAASLDFSENEFGVRAVAA